MIEKAEKESIERKVLIKWAILVLVGIVLMAIPSTELYTFKLKLYLTITVCAILTIAFELTDPMVPAVLMPTAYFITGLVPASVAFSGWTQATAWMIIGAFLLANVLDECGVLKRIAYWCIKCLGGTFNGVLYGLYIAGCVLALVSVNSAYAIVVTLAFAICVALGLKPGSKGAAVVMMVGATGALLPGVFLYRPTWASVVQSAAQTVDPTFQVLWQHVPMYNFPCILFGFLYVFVLTKLFKTSEMGIGGTKEYFTNEYNGLGKMKASEKKALVMVILLLAYVITCPIHGYPVTYAFMVLPWFAFVPGINIATKAAIKKLNIGTIFFVVSCLTIATVGNNIGLTDIISQIVTPIAAEAGSLGIMVITLVTGVLANLILTPLAMITSLTPVIVQVCSDLGMSPWGPIMTLFLSTDMYFLPHEVSALLLMYGFGMIKMTDFLKMATIKTVILFIGFFMVLLPWYMFMGIL